MLSAKHTRVITCARSFSAQPATTWSEAVSDKTAALDARLKGVDERLASVQKALEVNKEAIDKAVCATEKGVKDAVDSIKADMEKAVDGIKADVEKAVGAFKTDANGIKADMEKAVDGIKTDMKDALKMEVAAMEKVLVSEVSSVKYSIERLEHTFMFATVIFIFVQAGVLGVIGAAK